jgi:Undecaprenyl-phosphate galactose phosphotransferase WbaP
MLLQISSTPEGGKQVDKGKNTLQTTSHIIAVVLALSDIVAVIVAVILAILIRQAISRVIVIELYLQMWPIVLLVVVTNAGFGLYPAIGLGPANELRRLVYSISLVFVSLAGLTFIIRGGWEFSRIVFVLSWGLSLFLVPFARSVVRSLGSRWHRWGIPVVILTDSDKGNNITTHLIDHRKAGFRPVALLTTRKAQEEESGIIRGNLEMAPELAKTFGLKTAILVFPSSSSSELNDIVDRYCTEYRRLLVIPSFLSGIHIWVTSIDIGGNLGLEIMQNLLSPTSQVIKRLFDIVGSLLLVIVLLPVFILISIAIFINSPGPILYFQNRIGRHGKIFRMAKFRTMIPGAESELDMLLEKNESLREEWFTYQKLAEDPRITRVGHWLRRWSLDELPQVLNVIRGEMSLVGPRPMMANQIDDYGSVFYLYSRVWPGMTGLWQISGRNLATFRERARFDSHYVRNWSIWLDLYILAKTPAAILRGEGVY